MNHFRRPFKHAFLHFLLHPQVYLLIIWNTDFGYTAPKIFLRTLFCRATISHLLSRGLWGREAAVIELANRWCCLVAVVHSDCSCKFWHGVEYITKGKSCTVGCCSYPGLEVQDRWWLGIWPGPGEGNLSMHLTFRANVDWTVVCESVLESPPVIKDLVNKSGCAHATELRSSVLLCGDATWLILPVVICLSQRLSHACLSISFYTAKLRMAH